MSENKTCNICGKIFDYPYLLDRHKNGKRKCHKQNNDEEQIDILNINNTPEQNNDVIEESNHNNNNKKFVCNHCNRTCASKYSLERHYNVCKVLLLKKAAINNTENEKFDKLISIINDLIVDNRNMVNVYKKTLIFNQT